MSPTNKKMKKKTLQWSNEEKTKKKTQTGKFLQSQKATLVSALIYDIFIKILPPQKQYAVLC